MENGITVGVDMGDKKHNVCILDAEGEVQHRGTVTNTAVAIRRYFGKLDPCRVALEAGTHSAWVSRILDEMGYEVLVGNPRKLRVIWDSDEKNDDRDAEMLARIARFDPHLLYPIHHRGAQAQCDLSIIKGRDMLVKTRSMLVTHVRGIVKSTGERITGGSTETFHIRLQKEMPGELRDALEPIMKSIEDLTQRIRHYDRLIRKVSDEKYPETAQVRQISGVGPITGLAFILTLEDASRFTKSRDVGPFIGLTPRQNQSGKTTMQLGITKAGDGHLRRLLVGASQYILGPFGPDCDLRRFGLELAARGGKNAKRRAVVAVARKLAVKMHHLWKSGEEYEPLHREIQAKKKAA
jgi:transposase